MASNAGNTETQADSPEDNITRSKKMLEEHLRKLHVPDENRDKVVKSSKEKVRKNRNSADADALSRSQKEKKLDDFLRQKKGSRRRRRRRTTITKSDVRAQAEKILEEFLQEQLRKQDIQTSSPEYQRYVELEVTETTTPSSGSSGFQSSSNALRQDSIPYADESDGEPGMRKAESLPHDESIEIPFSRYQPHPQGPGLPIHHEKSKSAPYSQNEDTGLHGRLKRPSQVRPAPPPPPGTPHSASDNSNENLSRQPVPYTGRRDEQTSGDSLGNELLGNFSSLERGHSPAKKPYDSYPMPHSGTPPPASLSLSSNQTSRSYTPSSDVSNTTSGDVHYYYSTHPVGNGTDSDVHSRSPVSNNARARSHSPVCVAGARSHSPVTENRSDSPTKSSHHMKHSTYSSSSDSESEKHHTKGRKKKSMLKKAQNKVKNLLHINHKSASDDEHDHEHHSDHKSKSKKKLRLSKKTSKHVDESDIFEQGGVKVLEDTHTHTSKHIEQSTNSHGDRTTVLRKTDSVEIIDTKNSKGKKHVEKHMKMKESSSGGGGGFMGKLRRLTTRDKGKKSFSHGSSMTGSKSSECHYTESTDESWGDYNRAMSVPEQDYVSRDGVLGANGEKRNHLQRYGHGRGFEFSSGEGFAMGLNTHKFKANQVVSRKEDDTDMKRHSSYLDIVDYSGGMIDRLYFDAEGRELPRNKSFEYDQEVCVHEKHIDDHGHVRVERDVAHWDHMEIDGDDDDEDNNSRALDETNDSSMMTEAEREEMYGKIANRLANIGDNFMTEKEIDRSRSVSPRSKLGDDSKCVEEEIVKSELTPLEQEIRDELRRFADDMDDKLAANARTAALRISGLVTYNHFKGAIQDSVGNGDGWAQVAAVFHLTKRAVQMAGASGALAVQIKELSLKYIEDRFAGWIIGQGGWDSMLSEDESETDSELD